MYVCAAFLTNRHVEAGAGSTAWRIPLINPIGEVAIRKLLRYSRHECFAPAALRQPNMSHPVVYHFKRLSMNGNPLKRRTIQKCPCHPKFLEAPKIYCVGQAGEQARETNLITILGHISHHEHYRPASRIKPGTDSLNTHILLKTVPPERNVRSRAYFAYMRIIFPTVCLREVTISMYIKLSSDMGTTLSPGFFEPGLHR